MDFKDKPVRDTLKGYFKRNAIPTESNFAALIESAINQKEDGIAKLPGQPLCLQPDVDDTGLERVINFYKKLTDENPEWTLSLNPDESPGWNIGDAEGNSKLFIDKNTGNIGIGTTNPISKLHIHGNYKNTGAGGFALDASDNASPETYILRINPFVVDSGKVGYQFQTKSHIGGVNVPLTFDNAGNVGVGTTSPDAKLEVNGNIKANNVFSFQSGIEPYSTPSFKTGNGSRVITKAVKFPQRFSGVPTVIVSLSGFDITNRGNARLSLEPINITPTGFNIRLHTWSNTQIWSVKCSWMAYGL